MPSEGPPDFGPFSRGAARAALPASLPPVAGERVIGGRYAVGRKIAEGGMGAVFEGTHMLSKKVVALKLLLPNVGRDEATRQRFLREVAAPAQIGHDGIVEIYDAGFDPIEGILFVAMELLTGSTLRDRLLRGPLPQAQVLELFDQMLQPLAAAHRAGIVHRDLKPENVYLAVKRDGTEVVKVLDFGIARDLAGQDTVTQAGTAMGTPHYMSPEQAMSARDVTFSTDVWALGVMLYETLSGAPPFAGETIATLVVEICTRPHRPLADAAPSVPPDIAALVDRCLDKNATKRPANAGELLAELRRVRGTVASVPPTLTRELAPTMAQPSVTIEQVQRANSTAAPTADLRPLSPQPTPPTAGPHPSPVQGAQFGGVPTAQLGGAGAAYSPSTPALAPTSQPSFPGYAPPVPTTRPKWVMPVAILSGLGCMAILGGIALIFGLAVLGVMVGGHAEVDGELSYGDALYGRGQYADTYDYHWSSGEHVVVQLTSPDFDTVLVIRTPSGRELVNDDEGLGDLNSRIDTTLDETGDYQVTATSYATQTTGRYHLSVQ